MRKFGLLVAVLLSGTMVFAQDLTSKKGEAYLPEEGDYAIGMDAVPFLNYIGNFFGKTNMNDASNIWLPNNTNMALSGKYFLREDFAVRAGVRVGFGSQTTKNLVGDLSSTATSNPWPELADRVENKMTSGYTAVGLNGGVEWRRGNTRLQGYYGGEIGFMVQSATTKYSYGNELDVDNGIGVTVADDFGTGNLFQTVDGQGNTVDARYLTQKSGVDFGLGLRAFAGVEYFVLPKLSIGGEVGWGLALNVSGKSSSTAEVIGHLDGAANATIETIDREGVSATNVGVDGSLFNPVFGPVGRLNIVFHF